ncbi:hypothetical protein [Halogeometricum limi]|uniref:Uncharacterized protein n=1 Tax=Halogeometricum limi TaxID=555875 RepID=A0A1I6FWN5_9EURY|nr:hypothetical protein [Halogeometricum limi]SFR34318.1 hypothetical protein SAMN04488124_0440 [Halogeometricum limi]
MLGDSPFDDRIADVHYVACRECGHLFETIEDDHLTGDCPGAVTTQVEYARQYPDAPLATRESVERSA